MKSDSAERRKCRVQRKRPSMDGKRNRLQAPEISLSASSIQWCVAVQNFLPKSIKGDAHPIVFPDNRREVVYEEDPIVGASPAAQKADNAALRILAIHPFEAGSVEIEFV